MSSPPPPAHGRASRGGVLVVEVLAHNQEEELARIRGLARDFRIAAVAVSHDGAAPARFSAGRGRRTLEESYEAVRATVERATSAHVGRALASGDGELALGGRVWRFHLGPGGPPLADPRRVCEGIKAYARAAWPYGAVVTSDGAEDVAYLVRYVRGGGPLALPARRGEFLHAAGVCFPSLYDLRVLAEWTKPEGMPPPLADGSGSTFGRFLGLFRDACSCSVKMGYNAFLYGLGAADTDDLLFYKKMRAEYDERTRRLKEHLRRIHGHDNFPEIMFL